MSNKNQEVYIVQANRSAIGAFGGMLSGTKICTFISNDPPSSGHYVAPTQTKTHRRQLPPGLAGLVIAGVFAAAMSSLDMSFQHDNTNKDRTPNRFKYL